MSISFPFSSFTISVAPGSSSLLVISCFDILITFDDAVTVMLSESGVFSGYIAASDISWYEFPDRYRYAFSTTPVVARDKPKLMVLPFTLDAGTFT